MKKTIALLAMLMLTVSFAYAATNSGNISVVATLASGTPNATFKVYKAPGGGNIDFGTEYTSMNFNSWTTVQRTGKAAQWTSVDHYAVVAFSDGRGRPYFIKSLGTGAFVSGTNTLPAGSFACIPVYSADDMWDAADPHSKQGTKPAGATLAAMFAAINATAQTVYTSENPSTSRILQVRYGFVPYTTAGANPYTGYAPIPTSQAAGTYSGVTVKVSITQ